MSYSNQELKSLRKFLNWLKKVEISGRRVRDIVEKWLKTSKGVFFGSKLELCLIMMFNLETVADLPRPNEHKLLITNAGLLAINKALLKNPFITCNKIREKLKLVASVRSIRGYVNRLGWRKVLTKYCQIVSFENRVKRYVYGCFCKLFNEKYENVIDIDECSVVIRMAGYKNYRKISSDILRAVGGKIGKPKHSNVKIHLLGGISRKGLTPLVLFKGTMRSPDFQHFMSLSVMPFIRQKSPCQKHKHNLL